MPKPEIAATRVRAALRPGLFVLLLAALSLSLHLWIARSVLVPIDREGRVETVFVSATVGTFAAIAFPACGLLLAVHLTLRRAAGRRAAQPPLFAREDLAYTFPLFCFAASALGLLNLRPELPGALSVWSYLIVDLRWWWTALVLLWVVVGVDRRLQNVLGPWSAKIFDASVVRRWAPELTLVVVVVTWAVAGTPHLRFDGTTIGDEPKYIRYCETFYQGLGFEISQLRPIAELPADFEPRVWHNLLLLAETLPGELRSLASDAVAFSGDPSRRFNRARRVGGFLEGKDGGVYQVYNPGISMLIFPAYYLDRRLGDVEPGSPAQWPAKLVAVNSCFLGIYALWAVIIFRFLRRCAGSDSTAWVATLALTLTLPVAAFPFQFYPELAAGVILSAVAGYILFPDRRASGASFLYGSLAGYLPWLHVRFTILAGILTLAAMVALRRDVRRVLQFLAGCALTLGCYLLYAYRLTGSIMPTAIWVAGGWEASFSWGGAARSSVAYFLDREWGLFAHSPVYLFALPGYWWMARRRPDIVWLSVLALAALLVPAAGHTLHAAGSTPMRLIVAVLPFAATPLVELMARNGRTRLFQVGFGLVFLVSLHNALSYNLHHTKDVGGLVDWSFSGWKAHLLFPGESRQAWQVSAANGGMLVAWIAAVLALLLAPAAIARARERGLTSRLATRRAPSVAGLAIGMAIALGLLGTGVAAISGVSSSPRYRIPPDEAALKAALFLDEIGHCAICVSSSDGRLGTGTLMSELEGLVPSVAMRSRPQDDSQDYREWLRMPGRIREWYIDANGREPADEDVGHYLYLWREKRVAPDEVRRQIFKAASRKTPSAQDER